VGTDKETTTLAPEQALPGAEKGFAGFIGKFTVVFGARRELWLTFLIKFLIYTAYSITNKTLILWLSKELGFSDQAASHLVGWVWAPAMTVFTLLAGSLTDAIGLRRTFFLGVIICTVARCVMVGSTVPSIALTCGLIPLAIGEALGTPVLLAATRRYSTAKQRSMSFSIIYMVMNIGYFTTGWIFDYVRNLHLNLNVLGLQLTTHQQLFATSLAFEILIFPAIYFLRNSAEETDRERTSVKLPEGSGFWARIGATVRQSALETVRLFGKLISQPAFYRVLVFFLLIGFLKAIFLSMDYVFPKFGDRALGPNAPVGKLSGINAILIIILAPVVGALTQKFAAYRMVVIGGAICAAGVFIMALPVDWFQSAAESGAGQWLGHAYLGLQGNVHPYYVMTTFYLVVFSVGEAFYSPRVYEYAAAIAPRGQEASYGALAYIPFLIGKLLIGYSGSILARFCPAEGLCNASTMWLIFALAASVAPVGLILFSRYIRVPEAGRQED
jgi:MFS family permease